MNMTHPGKAGNAKVFGQIDLLPISWFSLKKFAIIHIMKISIRIWDKQGIHRQDPNIDRGYIKV